MSQPLSNAEKNLKRPLEMTKSFETRWCKTGYAAEIDLKKQKMLISNHKSCHSVQEKTLSKIPKF